jgi:hypothetical protein
MTKKELIEYIDRYDDEVEIIFIRETDDDVQILNIHSFEEEVTSPDKIFINLTY